MAQIPPFSVFKKEVFDNLSNTEKSILFYWSLIDSAAWWEENPKPSYLPKILEGKEKVLSILKKSSVINDVYIGSDEDKFFRKFAEAERLSNYLLAAEIEKPIKDTVKGKIDSNDLPKTTFPDIVVKETKFGIINIEIKGKIGAANLKDRINNEVLKPIENYKMKYRNFLLLLVFPLFPGEHPERINQLVEGFYTYEDRICESGLNRRVLCQCVSQRYSLEELGGRIVKVINDEFAL